MENQSFKKAHSGLSIAAFVFSLTIILSIVGVVLAIIDLVKKNPEKKHVFSFIALGIGGFITIVTFVSCISNKTNENTTKDEIGTFVVETTPEQLFEETTAEPDEEEQPILETANDLDLLLNQLSITPETARSIYEEIEERFQADDNPSNDANSTSEQIRDWENTIVAEIGNKYDLSAEDTNMIYILASLGQLFHYDLDSVPIAHGELINATVAGTKLIVKARINPQLTNKQTINQNYYNACGIIRSFGDNHFSELQYWAVSKMKDGSESKVISFTVSKDIIDRISKGDFPDNTLEQYLDDLWILPSLQK